MRQSIFFLLLLPLFCAAQTLPLNDEGKVEYSNVVNVDSSTAVTLYSKAKLFVADRVKETMLDDKDAKQVLGKGAFAIYDSSERLGKTSIGIVHYKLLLQCKDGKYRYFFTEFFHEFYTPVSNNNLSGGALENEKPVKPLSQEAFNKVKIRVDEAVKMLIAQLKQFMTKPAKDDW